MAGYKITERSARALARLLNDGGSTNVTAKGYRDSSFSRVRLARAPVGGIPARVTTTLGSVTNCNPIVVDPDTGVITVDTTREFQCYNLSESVVGSSGDRYIMVTNHSNGAFAIAPGGGGSLTECDALFSTLDTVTFATGDQVLVVRDGCLKLIDVDPCA